MSFTLDELRSAKRTVARRAARLALIAALREHKAQGGSCVSAHSAVQQVHHDEES